MMTLRKLALSTATAGMLAVTGCGFSAGADQPIKADSRIGYDGGRPAAYRGERDLPRDARLISEGRDRRDFYPREDGTVYVRDLDNGDTVVTRDVRAGDKFTFIPHEAKAWQNDRVVFDAGHHSDHAFQVYFVPADRGRYDRDRDRDYRDRDRDYRDRDYR